MKKLCINPVPCTGCLCCVAACSQKRAGDQDRSAAAIGVVLDVFGGSNSHSYCRQCEDAACASACPAGAIRKDAGTGAWTVDQGRCTGCRCCLSACPFQAIGWCGTTGAPVKCDLCGGAPACAEACHFGVIRYLEPDDPECRSRGMPDSEQSSDLGRGRDGR